MSQQANYTDILADIIRNQLKREHYVTRRIASLQWTLSPAGYYTLQTVMLISNVMLNISPMSHMELIFLLMLLKNNVKKHLYELNPQDFILHTIKSALKLYSSLVAIALVYYTMYMRL